MIMEVKVVHVGGGSDSDVGGSFGGDHLMEVVRGGEDVLVAVVAVMAASCCVYCLPLLGLSLPWDIVTRALS